MLYSQKEMLILLISFQIVKLLRLLIRNQFYKLFFYLSFQLHTHRLALQLLASGTQSLRTAEATYYQRRTVVQC
ncbi:uncharacterized protein PHALS_14989 [Plasmopara halstedii]|uniref:Uncharacterized protein n=1 Tax=Plasmopara halstedii TaxID=4781 RepID=A0A0P1A9B9_PLAHL|nr:uncharacterized protein PHALS_14989 [Plasmopara halstedii]CEG36930.1 hypothetical protein PHALS_14989 [Plasmopara halstedii]|eukprot:XP_024573299.1 hypothetical protein PHALS_14989 [Plasmopara halstedii]